MRHHPAWLLGAALLLVVSFNPAQAQLLDRLLGRHEGPPPYPYEEPIPPELLPEEMPPELLPEEMPPPNEEGRKVLIEPDQERAAPEKRKPAKAARKKEGQDPSAKKSPATDSSGREAEKPRSTAITKKDAEKAFLQVERIKTYFAKNAPTVRAIEKQKVPVIAGQPMPEDIELYPLPQEIAFEVTSSCPVNYFLWEDDIALVDSCSRQALAIIAGVSGPGQTASGGARQAKGASADISLFYDKLGSNGTWVRHNKHNYVFVPAVDRGWRPYVDGHWIWTDQHGWYWDSDEPFAWATYHYGRWGYEPTYGWYWVPGNVWAPAWVTWRRGGGHVGWAPLAPAGSGFAIGFSEHYDPAVLEAWVFVPERNFVDVDVNRYVVSVSETNTILGEADEEFQVALRGDAVVNSFLPREEVSAFVNADIETHQLTEVSDPSEVARSDGKISSFKMDIAETEPQVAPEKVASDPEQIEEKPVLQDVAKGEAPGGAPPSAADLKPSDGTAERLDETTPAPGRDETDRGALDKGRPSTAAPSPEADREPSSRDAARDEAKPPARGEEPRPEEDRPTAAAPDASDRDKPRTDEERQDRSATESKSAPGGHGRATKPDDPPATSPDDSAAESKPGSSASDQAAGREPREPRSAEGSGPSRQQPDPEAKKRSEAPAEEPRSQRQSGSGEAETQDKGRRGSLY
jgi:hypothetical protein